MNSKRSTNRGNDSVPLPLRSSDRIKRRPSYNGRSFYYTPYHISRRNKNKSRAKASRIAKMLSPGNRALDASNSNEQMLRRSKRKRRASSALIDYTSSASFGDDGQLKTGSVMRAMKNRIDDFNNQEVSSKRKADIESNPRREGLRPRYSRSLARDQLKYEADYHETSDEKANQNETENGFDIDLNEADEHDEEAQAEEEIEEDDDDVDGDGDDEEEEGEENEREEEEDDDGDEDEDAEEEEQEGKKRYDLRNRAEVRRTSMNDVKQRLRSPRRVLYQGIGNKDSREVRKSGSRVHKRHRLSRAEDSDDSLLVDEFDQGPVPPWARGGNRSSAPWLFGGLDLHGPTSWGLNVAASGWGHQSDTFAALSTGVQTAGPSSKGGADIQPLQVDENVSFEDIGGLSEYIDALKEMVFFPLLYPDFFSTYHITPPRGVLLCGPPGTGKTLIARALACAASKAGQQVSFYMRKGADVLSKWVGEAERQLKLLFEEAQRNQPSIIFFDEIDGLAPVRSSKQEQIHNSIVSTLLALMDGLDSRGQVVLIGATNRVDAIDGALRRPGRFDREFNFPLPGFEARAEILDIHTRKWRQPPEKELKLELAACCVGYCGADLKALCTEAAIRAFREKYPQVYTSDDQFVIDVDSVRVEKKHFLEAMATITPAAHRGAIVHSRPLSIVVAPCLQSHLKHVMERITDIFPPAGMASEFTKLSMVSFGSAIPLVYRPRLLLYGDESSGLDHLGPAVLHELEKFPVHSIGLSSLLSDISAKTPEEALVHIFGEARRTSPSVLYLPHLNIWWDNANETLKAVLLTLLDELPSELPILLLGSSSALLDAEEGLPTLFPTSSSYKVEKPTNEDRSLFFDQLTKAAASVLIEDASSKIRKSDVTAELPKVPKVATGLKASEIKAKVEAEQHALRRLRMCLRDVCNRLLYDKRFSAFHYPVTDEDAPNYRTIIENPMDIATLLQRVDAAHYLASSSFLQDIDLIVDNAKVYNGDDYTGSRIVSRAYELRDSVHGMLSQMDPSLVAYCDKISAQGGPTHLPHELHDTNTSPNVQLRSGGRTRSCQPDINVDLSIDSLKKNKKICASEEKEKEKEKEETEVDCDDVSTSGTHQVPDEEVSVKMEQAKAFFLTRTDGYGVPALERVYARIMKRVFEFRHAPMSGEDPRSFLFKLLMEFSDN